MKILIHCGSGNTDRPGRWHGINPVFTNLGEALIDLGHEVYMIVHSAAQNECSRNTRIHLKVMNHVDTNYIKSIDPDIGITWNGVSDGDIKFIEAIGRDRMIYGELGFFGHYDQTCYFDSSGVNSLYGMIGLDPGKINSKYSVRGVIDELQGRYRKPPLHNEPFIFIPLQDETDTQITQYSPFKTMNGFVQHVCNILQRDGRDILYKQHPLAKSKVVVNDSRLKEVKGDVHHYIPYADLVFGLNSTVMVETLLYHSRIVSYGAGIASKHFESKHDREGFIAEMYHRQFNWSDLRNPEIVKNSYLYDYIIS